MKMGTVTIKYEEEKLNAVKQYMVKKDAKLEEELADYLEKLYEKFVPQAVREYIETKGEVPSGIKKAGQVPASQRENTGTDPRE